MCPLSLLIVFYEYLILMLGPLIIYSIRYGMQYRFMYSNEMNECDSMIAVVEAFIVWTLLNDLVVDYLVRFI